MRSHWIRNWSPSSIGSTSVTYVIVLNSNQTSEQRIQSMPFRITSLSTNCYRSHLAAGLDRVGGCAAVVVGVVLRFVVTSLMALMAYPPPHTQTSKHFAARLHLQTCVTISLAIQELRHSPNRILVGCGRWHRRRLESSNSGHCYAD